LVQIGHCAELACSGKTISSPSGAAQIFPDLAVITYIMAFAGCAQKPARLGAVLCGHPSRKHDRPYNEQRYTASTKPYSDKG
jgi:hypothetical protein